MRFVPRRYVAQAAAVVLVAGVWQLTKPGADPADAAALASRFAFAKEPLDGAATVRTLRPVAPVYRKIQSWISSVGAAVALADVDRNGRPDDACLVDPRDDSVTVRPVPGSGDRYAPIRLSPAPLRYDATMAPMGCVPGDYDEDGRTDLLVYYWGRSPVIFRQGAGRRFEPRELVTPYQVWNTNAVTLADIDGDGRTDIVVGNYFPDGARVLDPRARQRTLWMQRSMSAAFNAGTDRILLARGGGRFAEARGAGTLHARGWTLALGAQDLDGDGRPELYIANDFGPDRLLHNLSTPGHVRLEPEHGVRHPTTPKSKVLGNDSFKGMGVAFTDLNGDGAPDILVSDITEPYALQESNLAWVSTRRRPLGPDRTAYYDDHSDVLGLARSGWGWDIVTGDFAGNGAPAVLQATGFLRGTVDRWPELQELAMTNDDLLSHPEIWPRFRPGDDLSGHDPDRFFVRTGRHGRFTDIANRIGVADTGVSRGIALADTDHDGRLDYAVAGQWRQSFFYRNVRTARRPYLGLRLVRPAGCTAPRPYAPATAPRSAAPATGTAGPYVPAIGALAELDSGAAGLRTAQLYPANGHGGASAPELLFGLAGPAASVALTWRDGCGIRHTARITRAAGWHSLLLLPGGTVRETGDRS
jgi:hypothetical protein